MKIWNNRGKFTQKCTEQLDKYNQKPTERKFEHLNIGISKTTYNGLRKSPADGHAAVSLPTYINTSWSICLCWDFTINPW